MRFFQHRLRAHDVATATLGTVCARTGALVGSPTVLRAGFGDVVARARSATLGDLPAALFTEVDVALDPAVPAGAGALAFTLTPFERAQPTTGWVFENTVVLDSAGPWLTSVHSDPAVALAQLDDAAPLAHEYAVPDLAFRPSPDDYARLVAEAVAAIRRGEADKVVLGRRASAVLSTDVDPAVVVSRLHEREPACTLYAVPVEGGRYLGASPELLVSVCDDTVTARPLAGTVALGREDDGTDPASWLLGSNKNLFEHRVVVEQVVEALTPLCADVHADPTPSVVTLRSVAHLGTWIHAKLDPTARQPAVSFLAALHPTPAVGGRPHHEATEMIARLEGEPRQEFAGAVGWMDAAGNGEWWVAIRGLTVRGASVTAWAGAGIVADSDPVAEREETRVKLDAILVGLGPLL